MFWLYVLGFLAVMFLAMWLFQRRHRVDGAGLEGNIRRTGGDVYMYREPGRGGDMGGGGGGGGGGGF